MRSVQCEAIVFGGGFSGTLLATLLARQGTDVVVLERQQHPRFAIGESSTPLANQTLRDLASTYDLPELEAISRFGIWRETYPDVTCGLKRGFAYFRHRPGQPFHSRNRENELLVAASRKDAIGDTHWLRAEVDHWFARLARQAGVQVIEGWQPRRLEQEKGIWIAEGLALEGPLCVRTRGWIFDATGPAAYVARTAGSRVTSHGFRTATRSVYTHVRDLPPWEHQLQEASVSTLEYPFRADDAAVHHLIEEGWIWQLPFVDGRVSVGWVQPWKPSNHGATVKALVDQEWLARYPTLHAWLGQAKLAKTPGAWISTGRLQRRLTHLFGNGWVALPHTYAFVDPFYSMGIAWSLFGIRRLARWWNEDASTSRSLEALALYAGQLERESRHLDHLIAMAYRAMPSPTLFHAATMVYFAAATQAERSGSASAPGFLAAEDAAFSCTVDEIGAAIDQAARNGDSSVHRETAAWIEQRLAPFNQVGLFHPREPHLYWETAAPDTSQG